MPYGFRNFSSTRYKSAARASSSGRARSVATARSTVTKAPKSTTYNAPVYKRLRRPRPGAKTNTGRNKNAIVTLARQVKALQNHRFGELQNHTQFALIQSGNLPTNDRPIAFMLNDFYDQMTYKGVNLSGNATFAPAVQLQRQTYKSDLNDNYEWNAKRNTDTVSPIQYKPVYTRLRLSFDALFDGSDYAETMRVTILKVKSYEATNKLFVTLPTALGAYRNLSERDYSPDRNYFDKQYHSVLYDKWVSFRPKAMDSSDSSKIRKQVTISWRYKDEVFKPDFTDAPSGQTFWTNVPQNQQYWVLISASSGMTGHLQTMEIGKFDSWRDMHGTS